MNIHILYDDCAVLPDPGPCVGTIIHAEEAPALSELALALGPMLDELGDAADVVFTSDPRWSAVVRAAGAALTAMKASDGTYSR
ncbi:hypothetical protein [Austwickia sp. TVS 96-490-7B]|uniref:SCO4402 family protein n=1 Tax=Austwickia sp. TVS 96-490-7B TaxID=2830843 RepID=UPI001C5A3546|nr:hypothetical protein [Austwickia sp. TVS 96-490-7B]